MQELIVSVVILLAALFMLRHIRRTTVGKGGCGCGCGSPCGTAYDGGRRGGGPCPGCSGACSRCQAGRAER